MSEEDSELLRGKAKVRAETWADDLSSHPITEEEERAAAALRDALEPRDGESAPHSTEGRFLAAHLRLPTALDSLGEVRAWRLARAARESIQASRRRFVERSGSWARLGRIGRSLYGTAGLLATAALLLFFSWFIVGQGQGQGGPSLVRRDTGHGGGETIDKDGTRLLRPAALSSRAALALGFRLSFQRQESPSARLDLMMMSRLCELRSGSPGGGGVGGHSLAAGAVSAATWPWSTGILGGMP